MKILKWLKIFGMGLLVLIILSLVSGSVPLYIITAADKTRYNSFVKDEKLKNEMLTAWDKMQKNLLKLSSDSRQIIAPKADITSIRMSRK